MPSFDIVSSLDMQEIDNAVNAIKESNPHSTYAILHCNSTYPAPNDELNLKCIQTLKERYKCEVGYSGHEFGLTTTIASVCLGATIIERHITLDRTMYGTDQSASLEENGLKTLVSSVRKISKALGDGKKRFYESEKIVAEKLRKNLK